MTAATGLDPRAPEVISAEEMRAGFDRLAAAIQPLIDSEDCVLLAVLNGGVYPLMELTRRLHGDFLFDFCHATRYRGATTGAAIEWLRRPPESVRDRTVLLVDDILDVGDTLDAVVSACREAGAVAVHSVIPVVKDTPARPPGRTADFTAGIVVPDVYVFGCGMDVAGRWRHLPAIYEWPENLPLPGEKSHQ
ncbi:MAG: hypoxanthine-guanine phosphoribosyltransferase [Gammaproteobacteria bacterium]|nr:hypoxanthine-guanine phosphoribosyltransferase [Gammaproteobacteria bacterium]NND54748.1 hypoxanthine-guanine phosphoribosyltransferase [Gammaproteobacteria bacterium]